jgi:hypothetical protein
MTIGYNDKIRNLKHPHLNPLPSRERKKTKGEEIKEMFLSPLVVYP